MGKIVLFAGVSLDGFMEGPDHDLSWHRVDEEVHGHFNRYLATAGGFLSGRVTWELMAEYWPNADADPAVDPITAEFAGIWRDMPKIVYSRTLDPDRADWNTTVVRDVVVDEVMALKAQPGGDLVLGGADLAATFRRYGLIDEYRISVHPVLVGRGTPLFGPAEAGTDLHLVGSRTFGNGLVWLHYRRADAGSR